MVNNEDDGHDDCLGPAIFFLDNEILLLGAIIGEYKHENSLLFDLATEAGPFSWSKKDFDKISGKNVDTLISAIAAYVDKGFIQHIEEHGFAWILRLKVAK